ncbi:hypothetical protein C8J56DRAFT_1065528 [Mycena floridula]|nr:hypothetical protein C8J56DRAFT_1065528 [Mycena floridula]
MQGEMIVALVTAYELFTDDEVVVRIVEPGFHCNDALGLVQLFYGYDQELLREFFAQFMFNHDQVKDCATVASSDEEWQSPVSRSQRINTALYADHVLEDEDPWGLSDPEPEWVQQVLAYGSKDPYTDSESDSYSENSSDADVESDDEVRYCGLHVEEDLLDREMERLATMCLHPGRRNKIHVSGQSIRHPTRTGREKRCLTAWFEINGLKAYTLCDAGSTTDALSPDFIHIAKIKAHPLENPMNVALGTVGSRSKINFGTYCNVKYGPIDSKEYWDVLNIDRYDAIVGTVFMRQHGIALDFKHNIIRVKGKACPTMKLSEDVEEHARRSRAVISGEQKPAEVLQMKMDKTVGSPVDI